MIRRVVKSWHAFMCRRNRHDDVLFSVGHAPGKECRYCYRPGFLSQEDIEEIYSFLPSFLQRPGDDNVVVAKEQEGSHS